MRRHAARAWAPALLALLFAAAVGFRLPGLLAPKGAPNIEAPWHVLLTVEAMAQNPVARHWFLPIVTLGNVHDKFIPWGATVHSAGGDFFYTSFSPPGFVVPFLWFRATGLPLGLTGLAAFNLLLHGISCALLYVLLRRAVAVSGAPPAVSRAAALAGSVIAVAAREPLLSQGLIYWHQSLYQCLLVATLLVVQRIASENRRAPASAAALLLLGFAGAWLEWTGFVLNAVLATLFWRAGKRRLALGLLAVSALAGLAFVLHFLAVLDPADLLQAMRSRFGARGASSGSVTALLAGYWASYGLFLPLLGACLLAGALALRRRGPVSFGPTTFLLLAASGPLLENVLLVQHATEFAFDRLKFIPVAALVIALATAHAGRGGRAAIAAMLLLAAIDGGRSYANTLKPFARWDAIDRANHDLRDAVAARVDLGCATLFAQHEARGYSTLLFGRNIWDHALASNLQTAMARGDGCAAVFLSAEVAFQDLPRFTGADILTRDGTLTHIAVP